MARQVIDNSSIQYIDPMYDREQETAKLRESRISEREFRENYYKGIQDSFRPSDKNRSARNFFQNGDNLKKFSYGAQLDNRGSAAKLEPRDKSDDDDWIRLTVMPGETLSMVMRKAGYPVEIAFDKEVMGDIAAINDLDQALNIRPGTVIFLPHSGL